MFELEAYLGTVGRVLHRRTESQACWGDIIHAREPPWECESLVGSPPQRPGFSKGRIVFLPCWYHSISQCTRDKDAHTPTGAHGIPVRTHGHLSCLWVLITCKDIS